MSIRRWSKVFTLGDRYTDGIWDGPVSITEKLDGSQLNFGVHPTMGLIFLTKGSTVHLGDNNKLFANAVSYIHTIEQELVPGWTYHGECLCAPRQNTLVYERTPLNYFALYGVSKSDGTQITEHSHLTDIAGTLGLEAVREIASGTFNPGDVMDNLEKWLDTVSQLGKEKIEGVVIKNYAKEQFIGGQLLPLMQAKFVSERFKERHKAAWPTNNKSPLVHIGEIVRTEARWSKAIQKLKESGEFEQHPRDIGKLLKYLHTDLEEEDKEMIKEKLWNAFSKDIKRAAVRGFPEFYKRWLVDNNTTMDDV